MSEVLTIGIDHGYAAMKTARCAFPTGLVEYDHEPYTQQNVLEYGGRFYVAGSGRQPLQKDKTLTEDYYLLPRLQECMRRMKAIGAKVNGSCGLHVHVDASNHNRQSLKNLIGIMYSKEDILFKALQVNEARAKRWCKKVREPMLKKARQLSADETQDLTLLENVWYEGKVKKTDHYNWTRYYALNLHSVFYRGTVEWRCFNSTLDPVQAAAYVHLCLAISAQAIAQRSTVMQKTHSDNELFTFRVWLVRLGLNGSEFKATRDCLLAHLSGDRAWRRDKDSYEVNRRKKKHRENER